MKKIVLLSLIALALCAFPTSMRADDVCHTIGSATKTDDMPGSGSFSSIFQMIFTKEELTAAGVRPGNINGIKFNWSSANNTYNKDLYIYMGATSKYTFASASDCVPASAFPTTQGYYHIRLFNTTLNGEKTYTFNSPFIWDGYSNIVIATIVNGDVGGSQEKKINFTAWGSDCGVGVNRCISDNSLRNTDTYSMGYDFFNGSRKSFRPVISFCQDNMTCPNVTNVAASNVTINSASITWDAASCTDGYDVAYSTSPVTDFSTATIQHVTTNSLNLTDLSDDTDYYVYVRARCTAFSDWSQVLYFKTLFDCSAPENVAITDIGKHQMTLNWNTSPKATSYDIIVSPTELANPSSADVTYANVTGTSKVFDNLRRETTYHVYIRANCGTNGYSDWMHLSATTLPMGLDCSRDTDYVCGTGIYECYFIHNSSGQHLCKYTQQIYTADELHSLGFAAGPIKAVEFNFYSDDNHYSKIQSIYIGTTDKEVYGSKSASEFVTGMTQVYGPTERTLPNAGGWLRYSFDTPFDWDGESNVVVGFLSNKCNNDTQGDRWGAYVTECKDNNGNFLNRIIYTYTYDNDIINIGNISDNDTIIINKFRLNIRFVSCPDSIPCPEFKKAPVASNITHNAATITWHVDQEDHTSYDMIVSDEEIADFTNVTPTESGITATSYNLVQLAPETDYYVYVRANYVNGDISECTSQWSPVCEFQTDEYCKTPYNLSVTNVDEHNATFNWNVTDNTATSFDLVVSNEPLADPSTGTIQDITATNNGGVCSSSLDHLVYNTYYYLYIRTDCGDGTSHWSSVEFNTMSILDCNSTQTVVVADGTANDNHFPVYGLVCDNNQKTQSIYPESMLTGLLGNKIKGLKYFVQLCGYEGWGNATFNIRMMITNETNISSDFVFTADATEVYSGTLSANTTDGMVIELTTPFNYTGGNLLIEFELPEATSFSNCEFYGTKAGGYVSCFQYGGGNPELSTFLPKVEFTVCEKAPACPALSAAPVASDVTYNSATITWNAGAGEYVSTYDIIVSENEMTEGETQHDASLQTDDTFYNLTGLNPETHYYVYVRVNCNADGYDGVSSLWSPACEFTTEPFCKAPENFAAEVLSSTTARLTWTKRGIAESWKIHIAPDNRTIDLNSSDEDCQIDGNQVSYTLTGLMPNTNDTLRLQSIDVECTDDLYADEQPSFRTLNNVIGITSFSLNDDVVVGDVTIDASNRTISVTTLYGTDLSNIAFSLTLADTNGIAKVGDDEFINSWDFTTPVSILVYAEDRTLTPQEWTITVVNETCAAPYNISVTNVDEHNATLNWNVTDNNATTFNFVVSKIQLTDPLTGVVRNVTATNDAGACNYALDHLTPDAHYYVYIRTNCGTETSHWSSIEFSTMSVFDCNSTQPVVVADGTANDIHFPVYGLYCDNNQKTQSIYLASMLTDLMGNRISKLKYFVKSGGSSFYNRNWENAIFNIRMMTTDQSTLSGFIATTNATLVYSGTLSANTTDGMVIELTTPFNYTGGNLLIEFELPEATSFSDCEFYGTTAGGYVSYFQYGDCNNELSDFLPKVEFTTCDKVSACPEVTDVAVTNIGNTSATITWTATGTYANTSDIYYSTTRVTDFTGIVPQFTDITGNSQQITGLTQNTTYYVYVRTHCDAQGYDDGISGWAGTSFLTLAPCRIPGALKATITGKHSATVTWTNTSGDAQQANNFTYILNTTPIAEDALETTATTATGVNATSVDLTNLQSETTYYFYLKNVCTDVNCSSPWVSCQFTMPAELPAVINLQVHDIGYNAFTATWESDIDNFADETEWEVACVAHGTQPDTWTPLSVPEYFALGLTAETTYDFYVRAMSGDSHSANAILEVTTIPKSTEYDCKEVIVCENGTVNQVPVRTIYKGSYSVQIYTADELSAVGCSSGDIEKIAFYQTECGNASDASRYRKNTTVWIGNTTKESFTSDNDWIHGLTQVMDEKPIDFNKNGDWVELQFDESFYWDGTNNLAVAVLAYSDSYTTMNFAGGSVTGDRSLYAYKYENSWSVTDGVPSYTENVMRTSELANIKLCFEPASCTPVDKLKVDKITATTARAHWYPGDAETTWHVYNSTTEMTAAELAALTQAEYTVVSTNPEISLDDLIKDTDYYLYVRAACGADEVSYWRYYKYSTLLTCSAPAEAIATTDNNSITFTVNPGDVGTVDTYDYRYWMVGSNDTVTVSGQMSPFTVSGLSGDKEYEWEVRANCSGTDEGSSRWVKGNTIHVCGVLTLPYFNDFEQYEEFDTPECWQVLESYTLPYGYSITFPFVYDYDYDTETTVLVISNNSSIATPLINVPAEGLRISLDYIGTEEGKINVMFTTNLTADESTYTPIGTLDNPSYDELKNLTLQFTPGQATAGYIVFSYMSHVDPGVPVLYIEYLDNLLIEAMPTSDTKDVTVDNVTYTISGLLQGNNVTIEEVSFNEDDLTEADFDITYNNTFLNYKHKLDIPETLTDVIKDRYKVVGIKADAFEEITTLTETVRVNIPAAVNVEGDVPEYEMVVIKLDGDGILYNGNSYPASMAYKVNLCDGATLEQRPFGEQTLIISCPDDDEGTDEDGVVTTQTGARLDFEDGWTETLASTSNELEASLDEDEVTIDVNRLSKICIADTAKNVVLDNFVDKYCEELKFQADLVGRTYPECSAVTNITLDRSAEVKAEFALDNKEYYYFSLPFDCNVSDIQVMAGTDVVERSNSIDEAVYSTDFDAHHYVLFEWDESAYNDSAASGYVAYSGTRLEKNRGYVIAVVESAVWYNTLGNGDDASLNVTATFTASDDYAEIASSDSEMEIPVTRADAANAYSGWNLVGNPFYGSVLSSQYSFNNYVRKVVSDDGIEPKVEDYAPKIPDFDPVIKPFETVFIQKSDAAGSGVVTVSGTSPVQKVQGAPAILPEYVTITLNDSSRMIDRTTIINDVLSSDDFLQQEDLLKSHQSSNEIYTQYGDFDFSFNEMNITDADKTIPLAVKVAAEGDYTIAMSSELSNYPAGEVFLHDKTLETYMKVSDGEVETLHLTEGVTEGRLEIVIKVDEVITIADDAGDETSGIAVYVHHGIATIEGIEAGAMVTIVDATGKTLYMSEATGNRMDYQFTVRGVYMITVRNNANVNTVKVVY